MTPQLGRPPAFRARAPPTLHLDAPQPAAQPSPVPVMTPNPLFLEPDVASFAPLREGATPRSGDNLGFPDPTLNHGRGAAPRAWDAALLFSAAAVTPGGCGWRSGAFVAPFGCAAAPGQGVSPTEAPHARRSHPGPLEASLSGLSAAAAAVMATAERLRALEAHVGVSMGRAADALAALARKRAGIRARQGVRVAEQAPEAAQATHGPAPGDGAQQHATSELRARLEGDAAEATARATAAEAAQEGLRLRLEEAAAAARHQAALAARAEGQLAGLRVAAAAAASEAEQAKAEAARLRGGVAAALRALDNALDRMHAERALAAQTTAALAAALAQATRHTRRLDRMEPVLTFPNARDEAAFLLFMANNARLSSARARCFTALVWILNLSHFFPNYWRAPYSRTPVHILRFTLLFAAYVTVISDQLRTALYLFQAKQASIRSLVKQERKLLGCALVVGVCCLVVVTLVSMLITNYVNLFNQVRVTESLKLAGLTYLCFAFQVASVTLFKPRLGISVGQALLRSPTGAFAVDLALGTLVAFALPLVLATVWEARMRAWFLSTHRRPHTCLGRFWACVASVALASDALTWQLAAEGTSGDPAGQTAKGRDCPDTGDACDRLANGLASCKHGGAATNRASSVCH
ncbi:hypothetical protein WJX81_007641 [Elliptochloris bilobata]|uniref:Uncharacterized protein n=1 Tax=Elliptochloris bilobata TaxID=381761 RepID=A0AAW1RV71_9CHLO